MLLYFAMALPVVAGAAMQAEDQAKVSQSSLICSNTQLQLWADAFSKARAREELIASISPLEKLVDCLPQRGDLRVELLGTYLKLGWTSKALEQRQQLVAMQAPEGILALVDSWLVSSRPLSRPGSGGVGRVDYSLAPQGKATAMFGYDTNSNSGSRNSEVLLTLGGIEQTLALSPDSLPIGTAYFGGKFDAVYPVGKDVAWVGGLELTEFVKGERGQSQNSLLAYAGQVIGVNNCWLGAACQASWLIGAGSVRQEDYQFANLGLDQKLESGRRSFGVNMLSRGGELESVRLGAEYGMSLNTSWMREASSEFGLAYDIGLSNRAGGDQVRLHASGSANISDKWSFLARLEWTQDTEDYSPALFGLRKRRQTVAVLRSEYSLFKTSEDAYVLLGEARLRDSNLGIFQSDSVKLELQYNRLLDLPHL